MQEIWSSSLTDTLHGRADNNGSGKSRDELEPMGEDNLVCIAGIPYYYTCAISIPVPLAMYYIIFNERDFPVDSSRLLLSILFLFLLLLLLLSTRSFLFLSRYVPKNELPTLAASTL